jgi:hypothetical protein
MGDELDPAVRLPVEFQKNGDPDESDRVLGILRRSLLENSTCLSFSGSSRKYILGSENRR